MCDWILFWQRQHMSALKVLGLKVGQPAAPVNTIWLAILAAGHPALAAAATD